MSKLELKIPPLIQIIIFALSMWLLHLWLPGIRGYKAHVRIAAAICGVTGVCFTSVGLWSFRKAKTTTNPQEPGKASSLVTFGVYKITRNPMYVGLLFLLVSWGVFLSNIYSLALVLGFVLYMNRFQIKPEETILELIFGEEYLEYKNRVRRWL